MSRAQTAERNAAILAAHEAGAGYGSIGRQYGMSRTHVKRIIQEERRRRMPSPAAIAKHLDLFVTVEDYLRRHTDARSNTPAQLPVPADEPPDAEAWQTVTYLLLEKGWRVAVDDEGEVWFYAPGPLSPPDDVIRQLN